MARVLVVAAHPDDEVLGCGATIAKHVKHGDTVHVLTLADGVSSREYTADDLHLRRFNAMRANNILKTHLTILNYSDNAMDTHSMLQIVKSVEQAMKFKPEIVYTHWKDLNVDHRITHEAVKVACRPYPGQTVKRLLYFEVPCSTAWMGDFAPDYFVEADRECFAKKLKAAQCYEDEMMDAPHPRSLTGIENMAQFRGSSIGVPKAEAFKVGRVIC